MKIWEIEEGREFKVSQKSAIDKYKIDNGNMFVLRKGIWGLLEAEFNQVYPCDFEYLPEKKYYLRLKPEMKWGGNESSQYLNFDIYSKGIQISNKNDIGIIKTQFTEKEIKELIPPLWLTVCEEPIEVEDE